MKIVAICVDCLRADSIGPRMQEFLDSGLEFTRAYAAGPSTIPSVPTNLTGVPAGEHGLVTARHKLLVPTISERLKDRGFQTVGYSANHLANLHEGVFEEWVNLNWMSWGLKATQDSYESVWNDIEEREGDLFAYVHLMDVHGPFRQIPSVGLEDFPDDYRSFKFFKWVNDRASQGEDPLTDEQWEKVWELYRAEVQYLDERLEFPGDLVLFYSDHGQLIREGERGAWLGHPAKFFLEPSLRIPFGVKGLGTGGAKCDKLFNLMYMPQLIESVLDDEPLPDGADLYYEDYWYECASYAIKNPECPRETLVMHSTEVCWYQDKEGNRTEVLEQVPEYMLQMLNERMERAKRQEFEEGVLERAIIERRLRGLGYM